jgi:hypothetical protein
VFQWPRPVAELSLALPLLLALGGCGTSPDREAGHEDGLPRCPTGGDPQPPVYMWRGVRPSTTSTTPQELEVCLNQNIDRLVLYSQVQSSGGRHVTSCITHDLSRVGRNPVDWAMGTLRTFPLDYPEALPAGEYAELVYAVVAVSPSHVSLVVEVSGRYFEVDANGLAPSTGEAYSSASLGGDNAAVEREPCPWPPGNSELPNDEWPADDTITLVNFDDWSDVATVQPLRHEVTAMVAPGTGRSNLKFGAWNAEGDYITLDVPYQPEAGTAFESRMATVHLHDADGVEWHSLAGHVVVTDRENGELEVALLDLAFERGRTIDEPRITRLIGGTISGVVRRECYVPSGESVDPTWSSEYCAEVRRVAGF